MCPGCHSAHRVRIGTGEWTWNGSVEKPTFTPSISVKSGHYAANFKAEDNCWCTYNAEHPDESSPFKCQICHSFVTDGRIQFLDDCTHELKGQTVDLPDWEY